jgi:HTH-type transcriptional regulator/antitoxin HigA
MSETVDLALEHWPHLAFLLTAPRSEADYDRLMHALNEFLDAGAANEKHPLAGLASAIGALIEAYDEERHPMRAVAGAELLRYLMDERGLRQSDLSDVGPQSVISDILAGRREINGRQALALAARFKVEAGAFLTPVTTRRQIRHRTYRSAAKGVEALRGNRPRTPKMPDLASLTDHATAGAFRTAAKAGVKRSPKKLGPGSGRRGPPKGHRPTRG